jgi:hypothetical protein
MIDIRNNLVIRYEDLRILMSGTSAQRNIFNVNNEKYWKYYIIT